jgi:hypothetical protein
MTTTIERPFHNLRRFNLFMGLFHLAQGVVMLALSDLSFKLPVTTAFLRYDETTSRWSRLSCSCPLWRTF